MNKYFKIILILCLSLSLVNTVNAQKRKKRDKGKNRYTENLTPQIPVFEMPTFNLDSLVDTSNSSAIPNNTRGADSLCDVVREYHGGLERTISGYRIQFWTGSNQNMMKQAIKKYKKHYSGLGLSIHTEYPDGTFRVKAGDWVKADHLIAHRYLLKIKEEFPQALLVPDLVDLDKI